jgi:hypothetical protein
MEVFHRYISVKADLISAVKAKYPGIETDESVVVHLRETDFRNHLRHVFNKSIVLPVSYYQKAIERAESSLNRSLTYHLFSDNHEKIKQIFKGRKYVLHNDNASMDWVGLFLGKNVIQSNSSFCWTASLYNKAFSIQPSGGYNWASPETGSVPYGFKMPFSEEIICQ